MADRSRLRCLVRYTALSGLGFVFRSAFGLDFVGLENAIGSETPIRKRLRIVSERIGQRIGTGINNFKRLFSLVQDESHLRRAFYNRARLNVSTHPKPLSLGRPSHLLQFGDCLVIGLRVSNSTYGKPHERSNNKDHQDPKLQIGVHIAAGVVLSSIIPQLSIVRNQGAGAGSHRSFNFR